MPPKLESDDSVKASQRCAAVFLEFILEQKEQNVSTMKQWWNLYRKMALTKMHDM